MCDIVQKFNMLESTVGGIRKIKKIKSDVRVTKKYFGTGEVSSSISLELSHKNEMMLITKHFVMVWLKRLTDNVGVGKPQIRVSKSLFYTNV